MKQNTTISPIRGMIPPFKMTIYCLKLLLLLLPVTTVSGQTIIKGRFGSLPSAGFSVVHNQSALNEFHGVTLAEGKTDANGQFFSSFPLNSEQPILFFISNQFFRLWVIPNTELFIEEINGNEFIFSGQAALQNNFLYQSGIMRPMAVPPAIVMNDFEPKTQLLYLDSIEQKRWILCNKASDKEKFSKSFASYCIGEITGFSNFNKNQYALQNIFGRRKISQKDIPSNYYDFWNQFTLLDDSCVSDNYRNSLVDYIGYISTKRLNLFNDFSDKEKYNQTELAVLDSLLADRPLTRERVKGEKLIFLIDYFDLPELVETQLANYKKEFPASEYIDLIQGKWETKNKITLSKPEFILNDNSGKRFDIKSLKGKVVYIDFWGSWCKACLDQLPNARKLKQEFSNRDVAFLYIDFYDTHEKWLKAISKNKITGIHVKAEKEDEKYFTEKFGIGQGFPRYALIDKKGVLVTSSAPGPGDKDAALLIAKYLE